MIYVGSKDTLLLQDVSQSVRPSGIVQKESTYITTTDPAKGNQFADLHPSQVTWQRQFGLTTYKITTYEIPKKQFTPTVIVSSVAGNYSHEGISFGFIKKYNKVYIASLDGSSSAVGKQAYATAAYIDPDAIFITDSVQNKQSTGSEYIGGDSSPVRPDMVLISENATQLGYIYEIEYIWELKFFARDSSGYSA